MRVDYNLHGLASVRLLDAGAADVSAVDRQLGPIRGTITGEPDITIRFRDKLETTGPISYLGRDDVGFTDDAFLVLRSKFKSRARVQIPMDVVGKRCDITCERGVLAVPLLIPILNLTVMAGGALPLHAAAFRHRGVGVLVTGWSKGGKTETLLAFGQRGAEYIGDEWVYIEGNGERMHGIPEPIRLWDWHLRQLPELRHAIGTKTRLRLGALQFLEQVERSGSSHDRFPRTAWLRRAMPLIEQHMHVDVPPEAIFPAHNHSMSGPFERLFLMTSTEHPETKIVPIGSDEVAARMSFSLQHERLDLLATYLKFRYAFPELSNPLIEGMAERQRNLLHSVLRGKPAYRVDHPYPVSFRRLFNAMEPFCRPSGEAAAASGA